MERVANWGNYPVIEGEILTPTCAEDIRNLFVGNNSFIPRGMGRSYGDASLHTSMLSSRLLKNIISIDISKGMIKCESGSTIGQILQIIVPKGYFLPIVPGTKFVTIGGAIAADIHGKNHHRDGAFSNFVEDFELLLASGEVISCSRSENTEIFWSTFGAMGLTGFILNASVRLKPIETAYMSVETIRTKNLEETCELFNTSTTWTYSVAWVDTLKKGKHMGRAVFSRGEHAPENLLRTRSQNKDPRRIHSEKSLPVPFLVPPNTINPITTMVFNSAYYHFRPKMKASVSHYDTFFFPLDRLGNWNRLYGKRGFIQFQAVFPKDLGKEALEKVFDLIQKPGEPSSLAVLKLFGQGNTNSPLSFPSEGFSIALDFRTRLRTFQLLDTLEEVVKDYNGRVYLAKDSRMQPDIFHAAYPKSGEMIKKLQSINTQNRFQSMQSNRLGITSMQQ